MQTSLFLAAFQVIIDRLADAVHQAPGRRMCKARGIAVPFSEPDATARYDTVQGIIVEAYEKGSILCSGIHTG